MSCDVGMIGLAVMGQNLALNLAEHGYKVAAFNRTFEKTQEFLEKRKANFPIEGFKDLKSFVGALSTPRKIILLVKAGKAVDELIEEILPLLEKGDILIDGGNSYYKDTARRTKFCEPKGIYFFGMGVSGGEEGARKGPSLMPGGSEKVWEELCPMLEKISAHAKEDGKPCVTYIGPEGAGHYVKMVHNGIEYGDIQITAEIYAIMRHLLGMEAGEIGVHFEEWNRGKLESFLAEAAAKVFSTRDPDGTFLIDHILDKAGQKGTGKWTSQEALDLGLPLTLVTEAVFARCLSSMRDLRVKMAERFPHPAPSKNKDKTLLTDLEEGMYAAKILSYTQGFALLKLASESYGWKLDLGACARIWRGGCIIQSRFLGDITRAFEKNPSLELLTFDPFFESAIKAAIPSLRRLVLAGLEACIPLPALASALTFFDGLSTANSSASVIQGLRDYFGAHTFERIEKPGVFVTYDWHGSGRSSDSASTTYNR